MRDSQRRRRPLGRRSLTNARVWLAILFAGLCSFAGAASAQDTPAFEKVIGAIADCGQLNMPMGVAVSPKAPHHIYVVDAENARIQVFDEFGTPSLGCWGSRGEGDGQFWRPRGIAISPDAEFLYIVDNGRAFVLQYRLADLCLESQDAGCRNMPIHFWGGPGNGDGLFLSPQGIAVDARGHVYIVDQDRNDVQVFDKSGAFLRQIGGDVGTLLRPTDVDVATDGSVWVADQVHDRIAIFDEKGEYKTARQGFYQPTGISLSADGSVIVRDHDKSSSRPRISRYAADGSAQGGPVELLGRPFKNETMLQGSAFLADGHAVLSNPYAGLSRVANPSRLSITLMAMKPNESAVQPLAIRGRKPGQMARPASLAIDDKIVAVTDEGNARVQLLDSENNYAPLSVIEAPMVALKEPGGLAIHRTGDALEDAKIFIADREAHSVFVVNTEGKMVDSWGNSAPRSAPGEEDFNTPTDVTVDSEGYVYIADGQNHRIVKRDLEGQVQRVFGKPHLGIPNGVTVGPDGLIYVIEQGRSRLTAFTSEGEFQYQWDASPRDLRFPEPGELHTPVAIDADDEWLYIVEEAAGIARTQIVKPIVDRPLYTADVLIMADSPGSGPGLVDAPHGVAAHKDGRVIIADSNNNRLQLFRWNGTNVDPTATPTVAPTATETSLPTPTPGATQTSTPGVTPNVSPTPSPTDQSPETPPAVPSTVSPVTPSVTSTPDSRDEPSPTPPTEDPPSETPISPTRTAVPPENSGTPTALLGQHLFMPMLALNH